MAEEGAAGVLAELRAWSRRLPLLPPFAVRYDVSYDLYEELRSHAEPLDKMLYGEGTVPRAYAAEVFVHFDWPDGALGVTWSDGSVESFQY